MCWFDTLLYHKMMTTIALANISIQSHHYHFFLMMRTFKISLSSLSWETWWNCTVSTPWVLYSICSELGRTWKIHDLTVLSSFVDLHLAAMPWFPSSAMIFDRDPRLWPALFYCAYSVSLKYSIERRWETYFICQSLSNRNFIFWLSPFYFKLSLLRLEELNWNYNSCPCFISQLIFLDSEDCDGFCLRYM